MSGKTQADIVKDLGFKQATVSDWVTGKKYPRVDAMQQLADYFNVTLSQLTDIVAKKSPSIAAEGETNITREIIEGLQEGKAMIAGKGKDGIDTIPVSDEEFKVIKNMLEAMRKARDMDKD